MQNTLYELGTEVYNHKDEKVGTIDRVVLDPKSQEVTHIVIRKGFLFTEDKVIPVSYLERSFDGKVKMQQEVSDLDALPDFEEIHYVRADTGTDDPDTLYWYPPAAQGSGLTYPPFFSDYAGLSPSEAGVKERNIPRGHVALKKNADVYDKAGEHVGKIRQVATELGTNEASYFIIEKGILFTEDKLVPAWWATVAEDEAVRLAVSRAMLDRLPEHELAV